MKDTLVSINTNNLHEVEKVQLVSRTVSEIESSKIRVTDEEVKKLIARLKGKLTAYQAAAAPVRRSKHTEQLKEADDVRDADVTMLFSMIRAYRSSKRANEQAAYKSLYALIKSYKDLSSRNYEEETGFIARLLTQLKSEQYSADVTTLNLTQAVTRLTESQTQFETLFTARIKSELAQPKVNYKQLRDELFYEYQRFCVYIDAIAWARGTEVYMKLLDIINNARRYFSDTIRKRQAHHKKTTKSTKAKASQVDDTTKAEGLKEAAAVEGDTPSLLADDSVSASTIAESSRVRVTSQDTSAPASTDQDTSPVEGTAPRT